MFEWRKNKLYYDDTHVTDISEDMYSMYPDEVQWVFDSYKRFRETKSEKTADTWKFVGKGSVKLLEDLGLIGGAIICSKKTKDAFEDEQYGIGVFSAVASSVIMAQVYKNLATHTREVIEFIDAQQSRNEFLDVIKESLAFSIKSVNENYKDEGQTFYHNVDDIIDITEKVIHVVDENSDEEVDDYSNDSDEYDDTITTDDIVKIITGEASGTDEEGESSTIENASNSQENKKRSHHKKSSGSPGESDQK